MACSHVVSVRFTFMINPLILTPERLVSCSTRLQQLLVYAFLVAYQRPSLRGGTPAVVGQMQGSICAHTFILVFIPYKSGTIAFDKHTRLIIAIVRSLQQAFILHITMSRQCSTTIESSYDYLFQNQR
jgi:hypothetical protein